MSAENDSTNAGPSSTSDRLSPIWNLRAGRNPRFSNRDSDLSELRNQLRSRRVVILNEGATPVGGLGKSCLAREYAYRHAADYQVVWWVQASETGALHLAYTQLMTAINLLRRVP